MAVFNKDNDISAAQKIKIQGCLICHSCVGDARIFDIFEVVQ